MSMLLSLIMSGNPNVAPNVHGGILYSQMRGKKSRTLILEALKDGPKTQREICNLTGLSFTAVFRHIRQLESEGKVSKFAKVKVFKTHSIVWKLKNAG